jgi:hypothetical protein
MEDHWVFGVCDWNFILFPLLYHEQRVPSIIGRRPRPMGPQTGVAWRHHDVYCPRPSKSTYSIVSQ